jgi:exopolyphosphatase/guanosine-5'-triphosphate,3'-diphosphate pyrophosphatase
MEDSTQPARLAAIDVGTNSVRLVVAEIEGAASYRILDDEKSTVRLGEGLYETGRLSEEAMGRTLEALGNMRAIAEGMGVEETRAIGTAALREADNGPEFLRAASELGVEIDVITEREEALLAFRSVRKHFSLSEAPTAIVDIGGGSLEVVLTAGGMIEETHSLPLGAIRLTEGFLHSDPVSPDEWKNLRKSIDRVLKKHLGKPPFVTPVMIGSGGTFSAVGNVAMFEKPGEAGPGQGYRITRSEWLHLTKRLREAPLAVRRKIRGLSPERADIIVAGAAAISRLIRLLGTRDILVHERGVRDGLLLTMIAERLPEGEVLHAGDRFEWAAGFARRCGFNEPHAQHVVHLASRLFDGLADVHGLGEEDRDLLAAAALLHDTGYLIGHSKHHKHAYHLIMHADLPGYTAREVEIIANVARYHRRAFPRRKHPNFARLEPADQDRVRMLAGMLRLADGLDRTHAQAVRDVAVRKIDGSIQLSVDAESDPQVEIWDATRKRELFEEVFRLRVEIAWTASGVISKSSS